MSFDQTPYIRVLTTLSLGGLLFGVGLRLTAAQVRDALGRSRPGWLLAANFVAVPLVVLGCIRLLDVPRDIAVGMLLLAAAPFAPVVPVFARMAKADLPLAAVLTGMFPFAAVILTPLVCEVSLRAIPGAESLRFSFLLMFGVLMATITLPMALGVIVRHHWVNVAVAILRPMEFVSEMIGAVSLAFVTLAEWRTIAGVGWKPLLAMVLACEATMLLGYAAGSGPAAARRVTALGTSNRNIALALLVAVGAFAGTPVLGAVVANGLVLILLGLVHVAVWRAGLRPA
jgi:BASS family bile acid:Na+ symporter